MLVVGTGAVASFLLPRLQAAGFSPQVFGSPSVRVQALLGYGAVSDVAQIGQHDEWLVVCKTWQNAAKVGQLLEAPAPRRLLVLQNGLAPELDWTPLGASMERGLSTYGVATSTPGQFTGGEVGEVALGALSCWAPILRSCGLTVREETDMLAAAWWKLVINASLNVVAALGELRNGEVIDHPPARRLAGRAASEVAGLARALGVNMGERPAVAEMERVARATAGNVCSTLADLRAGRPTEYESINGAVLRLALANCWSMPVLEELDRRFISHCSRLRAPRQAAS